MHRNKTEWIFLFLKVVMVQLVAKPFTPSSPSSPLPASCFSPGNKWLHQSQLHPSLPLPTLPGRGTGLEGTQISPGALGDLGLYSQGSAGVAVMCLPSEVISKATWRF